MRRTSFVLTLLAFPVSGVWGLINPDYTPVELVRDAETIFQGTVQAPQDDSGKLTVTSVECIKGKAPAKFALRYGESVVSGVEGLRAAFGPWRTKDAMVFLGDLSKASMTGEGEGDAKPVGGLRVGQKWFGLFPSEGEDLEIRKDPINLKAVWAGDIEMLARLARYVLSDERAEAPAAAGTVWRAAVSFGDITGKVNGCMVADVNPVGRCVTVLADSGDRVFRMAGGSSELRDITSDLQLTTKSRLATWADLDGDGATDLISWDGKEIVLWLMSPRGRLSRAKPFAWTGCRSLSVAMLSDGKRGFLVVGHGRPMPVVCVLAGSGEKAGLDAAAGVCRGEPLWEGEAGPSTVADFDGDGFPDVVETSSEGIAFYRGTREGASLFADPVAAHELRTGQIPTALLVGDYDGDGRLDFTLAGKNGPLQLANAGKGRFETVHEETGELAYYGEPNVSAAVGFDINNDGREELALMYPDAPPLFLFNRGFRCFGRALSLALDNARIPNTRAVAAGQQAAAASDLDGDGLQEVVVVDAKGGLVALFQEAGSRARLSLEAAPPPNWAGPVNVVAYDGKRCLGARMATATTPAFFGKTGKGSLQLKWKDRLGRDRTETVALLKPSRFTLTMD